MKKLAIAFGLALLMTLPSWASSIGVGMAHWDTQDAAEDQGFGIKVAFSINEAVDVELRATRATIRDKRTNSWRFSSGIATAFSSITQSSALVLLHLLERG